MMQYIHLSLPMIIQLTINLDEFDSNQYMYMFDESSQEFDIRESNEISQKKDIIQHTDKIIRKKDRVVKRYNPNEQIERPKKAKNESSQPIKNKYISKLKSIAPEKQINVSQLNNRQDFGNRKQRGKLFAKRCRDRKKLYIQLMEAQQAKLNAQIQQKNMEIQLTRIELQKVISQNTIIGGFLDGRYQFTKKIQYLIRKNQDQRQLSSDLNIVIDSLRFRIGATGKERISTINQYYKRMINLSFPAIHRYLLWSAGQSQHFFDRDFQEGQKDQFFQQLSSVLSLSADQITKIQQYQQGLNLQRNSLIQPILQVKTIKDEIYGKSLILQEVVDNIRDNLTAIQTANLILFTENNKYRQQLNLSQEY